MRLDCEPGRSLTPLAFHCRPSPDHHPLALWHKKPFLPPSLLFFFFTGQRKSLWNPRLDPSLVSCLDLCLVHHCSCCFTASLLRHRTASLLRHRTASGSGPTVHASLALVTLTLHCFWLLPSTITLQPSDSTILPHRLLAYHPALAPAITVCTSLALNTHTSSWFRPSSSPPLPSCSPLYPTTVQDATVSPCGPSPFGVVVLHEVPVQHILLRLLLIQGQTAQTLPAIRKILLFFFETSHHLLQSLLTAQQSGLPARQSDVGGRGFGPLSA